MIARYVLVLYLCFNFLICMFQAVSKKWHIDLMDARCRGKSVPIRGDFKVLSQENKSIYLNVSLKVTEDIPEPSMMSTKIIRCQSKESLDTCETFLTVPPSSYCDVINPKLADISPFFIKYTPPYACPIKKGTYYANNSRVSVSKFLVLPFGDWYWKFYCEVTGVRSKRLILCLKVEGRER